MSSTMIGALGGTFSVALLLARSAASLGSGACPSEYVAVPAPGRVSRP